MPRALPSSLAAATLALLAGCAEVREAIAPGRAAAPRAQVALRVALAAPDGATLALATAYLRGDGTRVPIGTSRVVLDGATSSAVPLAIDLASCLADDAARVAPERPSDPAACRVVVTLRYAIEGTLRDAVTIGPLVLAPGVATAAPSPVTVVPRLVLRLATLTGTPIAPGTTTTLLRGQSLALRALVTDSTLATTLDRAVQWSSSSPTGAPVTPAGVVSALADGTYTITAALPDGLGSATTTVRVVPPTVPVTLALSGTGSGTVSAAGAAPCTLAPGASTASCTVDATIGAPLVLTATPGSFTTFGGFGGLCASAATTCTLTPTVGGTVTATFPLQSFPVSVAAAPGGTWSGSIRSTDGAIDCRITPSVVTGTCTVVRPALATVTLTAIADTTGAFGGWGGACAASAFAPSCTRTVTGPLAATGAFSTALEQQLTLGGSGGGRVDVTVDGVARTPCTLVAGGSGSVTCRFFVRTGAPVLLTATPTAPFVFSGFDANCEELGPTTCRFTMTASFPAFAGFQLP